MDELEIEVLLLGNGGGDFDYPEAVIDVIVRKLSHMAEYGVLAALCLWALGTASSSIPRSHFLYAFVLAMLCALSDELHQRFVPGRDPRALDVGFDVAGAALTLLVISTARRVRRRRLGD